MKMLLFNIRGVGSRVKRKEVQDLVRKNKIDLVCIQESKLDEVNENVCRLIWGNNICGWAARESQGRSGGLITLWDSNKFTSSSWWHMEGALIVNGRWISDGSNCCIVNVYAPCPLEERKELWDRLNLVSQ